MSDESSKNVYDMDGPNFDSEAYVNKTLREYTLKDVMNVETAIIRWCPYLCLVSFFRLKFISFHVLFSQL